MDGAQLRAVLLEVIDGLSKENTYLQTGGIVQRAARQLGIVNDLQAEQALLTFFHDLFRTGYLSWGYNLANDTPPFFHVTALGRQALAQRSRDPANPDGYLSHLRLTARISAVTESYISEALHTFNATCFKATAVLVGAAAEGVALDLRDTLVAKLRALRQAVPADLTDWRLRRVLRGIEVVLTRRKDAMPKPLFERFEAHWPAFTHQIRTARNEAGHPVSVDPVTAEEAHGSLLIFPALAAVATELGAWIDTGYA